ncbi:MAG: lipid A biosynthesis acyltransferase [Bacteroidales bacterium]|nr:lipid A biosynthesis acyltransferase [Bacteroidales bacterium]
MEKQWAGTTYGNGWMHKWLIRILKHIDTRVLYVVVAVFVIPICLLINRSCGITYRYFRHQHNYGRLKAAWNTYVNHCKFGQVVVDKFAMYAGKHFDIDIEGYEHYLALTDRAEGFIQLSSHVGNYEIAGYTLKADKKRINALLYFGEKASVMQNRSRLFTDTNTNMIAIRPDMGHLFEIDEALTKGEVVSIPADRIFGSKKTLTLHFLNNDAHFPYGPFSIATMRGLDVLAIHVLKTSWKKYHIVVTPLDYNKEATRREQIAELSKKYVDELERIVRHYPTQWFNYFEFWQT